MFSPKRTGLTRGQWFGVPSEGPLGEHWVLLVRTSRDVLWFGKASYFVSWISTQSRTAVTEPFTTQPPKITLLVPNIMAPTPICHLLSFSKPWGDSFASPLPAQPLEDGLGNELCSQDPVCRWGDIYSNCRMVFPEGMEQQDGVCKPGGLFPPLQFANLQLC